METSKTQLTSDAATLITNHNEKRVGSEASPLKPKRGLHKSIQAELDKIPAYIDRLKCADKLMWIAEELEAEFKDWYLSKSLEYSGFVIVSFKFLSVAEAAQVLRYLAVSHDLHQAGDVWVYPPDKSLNWRLPGMRITGHFSAEEAKCRFVKVGVKEEPVYEMQCEGKAIATEEAR